MQFHQFQILTTDFFQVYAYELPVGTVLTPSDGSSPRVVAKWTDNDGFIFTDKSGFHGVEYFTIAYLPDVADDELSELDDLTGVLKDIFVNAETTDEVNRFERMAAYILDNYERIPENDDLPLEVIDVDGDTWLMSGGTYKCVGDPECDNLDLTLLEEFYGPLEIVA